MSKGVTGHGKYKCGKYRCKGGCEKSKPTKSLVAKHYESRPTAKEYQDPIKNELASLIGINEDRKETMLSLYERLYSSLMLKTNPKSIAKEDLKEAVLNDRELQEGYIFSEPSPGVIEVKDKHATPERFYNVTYDFNNMTMNWENKWGESNRKGKDMLGNICDRLKISIEQEFNQKDKSVADRLYKMRSSILDSRTDLQNKRSDRFKNNKKLQYEKMSPTTKVSYNDFIDRIRDLQEQGKVSGANGYKGSYGARINTDCSIFATPDYETDGHHLTVKYWEDQKHWIRLPMTKGNIESIIKNPSKEEILKLPGAKVSDKA